LLGYGAGSGITTGNNNTIIGVNIATLASGTTNNVILADGGGNIALRKDANHFVGVGYSATATLGAKLDVRAQGALSTDIAFRVRNSADSANLGIITGDGAMTLGVTTNANTKLSISGSAIGVSSNATLVGFSAVVNPATQINSAAFDGFVRVSGAAPSGNYYGIISGIDSGNVNTILHGIRASATGSGTNYGGYFRAYGGTSNHAIYVLDGDMRFGATTTNKIGFWNTNPILQPTTAIAASTLVSNLGTPLTDTDTFDGYTIKQVVKALRNMGILA
jgi:hypothetical protein